MRRFWKRDEQELARLERELRAYRSEPRTGFVRELLDGNRARRHSFRPRLRYALLGGLAVAMFAASASAGLPSLPMPVIIHSSPALVSHSVTPLVTKSAPVLVTHSATPLVTKSASTAVSSAVLPSAPPPPPPPGDDQYKGKCGKPPAKKKCVVEVEPDNPSVNVPKSPPDTTLTFTLSLGDNLTPTNSFTINWATIDGTATGGTSCSPGVDYYPKAGSVTFTTTDNTKTVSITICSKTANPNQKKFTVTWTSVDTTTAVMDNDDNSDNVNLNYKSH